jgi:hypothetical protein
MFVVDYKNSGFPLVIATAHVSTPLLRC